MEGKDVQANQEMPTTSNTAPTIIHGLDAVDASARARASKFPEG